MGRIRILLVDDHALVRAGLRALIQRLPDMEVVGETGDGSDVLSLVQRLHPDLILMDIALPHINGLELTSEITQHHHSSRVLIVSIHKDREYVLQSLRCGACGFLPKDADADEFEFALRAAMAGETYLSPSVSRYVVDSYINGGDCSDPLGHLTHRQRQILQLIAEGHTTSQMAQTLSLSPKTIETHRAHLMARLDIHDIAGLVRYAIQHGLVLLDS